MLGNFGGCFFLRSCQYYSGLSSPWCAVHLRATQKSPSGLISDNTNYRDYSVYDDYENGTLGTLGTLGTEVT